MNIRQIPDGVKSMLPVTAMYNTLRLHHNTQAHTKTQHDAEIAAAGQTLAKLALAVYSARQIQDEMNESTQSVITAMENVLQTSGISIIDFTGQEVTHELMERVSIEGWQPGTETIELVQETFTPEIQWNGTIIHGAQVFCSRAVSDTAVDSIAEEPSNMAVKAAEAMPDPPEEDGEISAAEAVQGIETEADELESEVRITPSAEAVANLTTNGNVPADIGAAESSVAKEQVPLTDPLLPCWNPEQLWRRIRHLLRLDQETPPTSRNT